jgi:hypothetical protein
MLSKSLGKLHPKLDSLQAQNDHMECTDARCREAFNYFTIQDVMLAPPEMPTTYAINESQWIRVCKVDQELLASFGKSEIK